MWLSYMCNFFHIYINDVDFFEFPYFIILSYTGYRKNEPLATVNKNGAKYFTR